jgi:aminoglycoside phosphotransferase (APT) family kinase protein
MKTHDEEWVRYLRQQGYKSVEPLAAGMEGAVYRIGQGLVAKIWQGKSAADVTPIQHFYADLLTAALPFATPEVLTVLDAPGAAVTVERELSGRPLREYLDRSANAASPVEADCIAAVLRGLHGVQAPQSLRDLPVIGAFGLFDEGRGWPAAMLALLAQRTAEFGGQLADSVPGFAALYANLVSALSQFKSAADEFVIHGDISGENILVDENLNPLAVLDWGFFSTAGDQAFDASVAAGIFNMYGPYSAQIDQQLRQLFTAEFGYPAELLAVYRGVYAIATSNVYDPTGQDGHFNWCVRQLTSPSVRSALA